MSLLISPKSLLIRSHMCKYAGFLYFHRALLGYDQVRPMRSFPTPFMRVFAHDTDCSESLGVIAQASGAPTPYVSNREGNTGTMLEKLPHINRLKARRGDFVVFGGGTGEHVVMLMQRPIGHPNPLVWSHGAPGVNLVPLSFEQAGFPGQPMTFLRSVPPHLA